ncbi:alpha/beta fold hydrolase [Actinoallomurus sp. CA-150999]|uniref:alpha/beta fold hydrolase n=1 Tax=Actinoallomurus sp. CA-150999 TaxID=3239887 RepID=UPI003D8A721B
MTTYTLSTSFGDIPLTVPERGQGRPVLLLHGGAGPNSVAGFADLMAARSPLRVLTPVNPGFGGTPRPDGLDSIRRLGELYRDLLDHLDLLDVTVIGSSIGGWAAAEVALCASERVERLILVDAVGLDSAEHPVADFFSLTLDQVADFSYANPDAYRIDLGALTDEQKAVTAGNRAALQAYGGRSMSDPSLAARLAGVTAPTLVVWGEADRIATPAYGKEYAAAIPGAAFHLMPDAGHLPQIETPEALLTIVDRFIGDQPT